MRPPATPVAALQLSLALYPLAAPAHNLRLASAACTPARPVANLPARIGFVSFGSTGCKPPTCVDCYALPLVLRRSIKLAPDDPGSSGLRPTILTPSGLRRTEPFLRLGRQPTSDSHRCRPLARLAASSGLRRTLPLPLGWLRLQFAPAASPSVFTGREPLGLRLVAPSPAEPLMHSLFQPNLASTAEPSMSIPFPPALASSGINPVEQPWACALTCNLWCVQRSLCGLRLRFHPLSGLAAILRFSPAVHSVNLAGDQLPACADCLFFQPSGNQLRCPNGSSVE